VQQHARDVATSLSAQVAEVGPFELITKGDELPAFPFKLSQDHMSGTGFHH
jgi:glutamate decarboxylase